MTAGDTRPKAEAIQIDLLRKAPTWKPLRAAAEMSETVMLLSRLGVARRNPSASPAELRLLAAEAILGPELASSAHGVARSTLDADIIARLDPGQASRLAKELGPEFDADVEMERRQLHVIDPATGESMAFSTAEDTLLAKPRWYRQGNEASERQWRDVLGILRIAGQSLGGCPARRTPSGNVEAPIPC